MRRWKKQMALVMSAALIFAGLYTGTDIDASTVEGHYDSTYRAQIGIDSDDYSGYFYDAMEDYYIYKEGDEGNDDGIYTGMVKYLTDGLEMKLTPDWLVLKDSGQSFDEFVADAQVWLNNWYAQIAENIAAAFDAFIKDYPEVYWIESMDWNLDLSLGNADGGGYEAVATITLKPVEYVEGVAKYAHEFNDALYRIESELTQEYQITDDTPDVDIARYIHDWVVDNAEYNYDAAEAIKNQSDTSHAVTGYEYAYMPLTVFDHIPEVGDWSVICEGYSKAYEILCDHFDVECVSLIGSAQNPHEEWEPHMWNLIKIEDAWYAVDTTWDDQEEATYYEYFLAGLNSAGFYMPYGSDHVPDTEFSNGGRTFVIPQVAEYGYYYTGEDEEDASAEDTSTEDTSMEEDTSADDESSGSDFETQDEDVSSDDSSYGTDGADTGDSNQQSSGQSGSTTVQYNWSVSYQHEMTYTGSKINPQIKITSGTQTLKEGTDYKVSYKNNVNVGIATVILTPIGQYEGMDPLQFTFNITKASIKKSKVGKIKAQKYHKGKAVKPKVKVKFNGSKLKKNTDYTVTYKKNKHRGTARAVIKGKGNFKGKKVVKFKIK